jgi:ABC-2 type transport system permease protein
VQTLDLMAHEWKTRLARPAAIASLVLFVLVLAYGTFKGDVHRDSQLRVIEAHETEIADTMTRWLTDLQTLEQGKPDSGVPPWAGSPMDATFASALPPGALADFAIGQRDLLPYFGSLSLWDPDIRLFTKYELAEPVALALGGFDISKAMLLMAPLLLIILTFDVLSAETDAQRLTFTLVQGASIESLFWRRLLIRSGVVLAPILLVSASAAVLNSDGATLDDRFAHYLLWLIGVCCYLGFWIALIGWIASRNARGVSNVLVLLLAWAGLTLVLPAVVSAVSETLYPMPSRLEYLAHGREVEIETELAEPEITQQLVQDHPELFVTDASAIPAYVRTAYLVTSMVDKATREVLTEFEQAAQKRERALALLRFVSPAIVMHGFFNDVAGASTARHRRYVTQARAFKSAYAAQAASYILMGERLPSADAAALPHFEFSDTTWRDIVRAHARALLALALMAGVLLMLAGRRVSRIGMLDE